LSDLLKNLRSSHLCNVNEFDLVIPGFVHLTVEVKTHVETVFAEITRVLVILRWMERPVFQCPQLRIEPFKRRGKRRTAKDPEIELVGHGNPGPAYGVLELQAIRHSLQRTIIRDISRLPQREQTVSDGSTSSHSQPSPRI
jgi:hypothetical protein